MKKTVLLILVLTAFLASYSQIGINTTDPKTTLHVIPKATDNTTAEGIIAPNLTRAQLISKDAKYITDQRGAIVYVTDLSGTPSTKTAQVTQAGYYYFDGTAWKPFGSGQSESKIDFFYAPPMVVPIDITDASYNASNKTFTLDLYQYYSQQFGLSNINSSTKSPTASSLAPLAANKLEYFVMYYDNAVFSNVSITDAGILTYRLQGTPSFSAKTFMNIVYKIK